MVYFIGWGLMYLALLASEISGHRSRIPLVVVITAAAIMAVLRGSVGTDTSTYEWMLDSVTLGDLSHGVEPSFVLLGWFFKLATDSSTGAVRLLSLVFFVLLFVFVMRANKNERFYLLACFLPAFVYQYSMNALRLGLASICLLLAFQWIRQSNLVSRLLWVGVALTFHYSSIFVVGYLLLQKLRWFSLKNLSIFALFALAVGGVVLVNIQYFLMKLDAYSDAVSPGSFSGMSKVILIGVMLVAVVQSSMAREAKFKLLSLTIPMVVIFFGLATLSYAGLRFLDLLAFAVPLVVLLIFNESGKEFDWRIKAGMVLFGLLSVVASSRNYFAEATLGPSPFLPYHVLDALQVY